MRQIIPGYRLVMLFVLAGFVACDKILPAAPPEDSILDGPVAELTSAERKQFLQGDIAFNEEIFTASTGLGPLFVATSCGTCHAGDGKGHPFTTLTRFGQTDSSGNRFLHQGGPQLQNRALQYFQPETIPAGAGFSKFTPPANTGLGFLEAVSDADLLSRADPADADQDGISGRPNWVVLPHYIEAPPQSIERSGKYIGRFGKKAANFNLLQQTVRAYNQDIGITSSFEPFDTYSGHSTDPEISDQTVLDVVFYLKTLKAPIPRNGGDPETEAGRQVFLSTGCGKCHTPEMKTGASPIEALSFKTFYPYTDLLLHDMGSGLDDGYTEGTAATPEWRTPPLWGLGLSKNSQGGRYFLLHDGRAGSIGEAIEWHGGEAAAIRENYRQLTPEDKSRLIRFLESL